MEYAFYPGCLFQTEQYGCHLSTIETLRRLGLELKNIDRSSCCGYISYRLSSPVTWTFLTARNMALAQIMGLEILTVCNECHISFLQVKKQLAEDPLLRSKIDDALKLEDLEYHNECEINHIVEVLYDKIGVKRISKYILKPLDRFKFTTQPGCHLFRPKELSMPDGVEPYKLDELVRVLGAEIVDYPEKLDCCGALIVADDESTRKVANRKLRSIKERRIDGIVTICPHCFKMLDTSQGDIKNLSGEKTRVPVIHYTQLLGLAMGINAVKLGLQFNQSPVEIIYRARIGGKNIFVS